MEENGRRKIVRGATGRRLIGQILRHAVFCAFCVAAGSLFAARGTRGAIAVSVAFFAGAGVCLYFTVYYACAFAKIAKKGKKWNFAVTESASFECWWILLAMNVTFRDGKGEIREGRSRFIFHAHDVEAWQNVPLEIAYSDGDERVVIIGSACGNRKRET